MLSPYIHAALAHERHQAFLARAETSRRARRRTGGSAVPVIRHHRLRVGAGLRVAGWEGGWRSWTPVFICR
jgi:hypothetical protein